MSWRRGGRLAWLPAYLLWVPLLFVGVVLVTGLDVDVDAVGDLQRVRVDLPLPQDWLGTPVLFGVGCVLLLAGAFLAGLAMWRPDPDRHVATVAVYGWFVMGALLAVTAAALAAWTTQGHVVDASSSGLQWRFLVGTRGGAANMASAVLLAALGLGCAALSIGNPWPLVFKAAGNGTQPADTAGPTP